MLPSSNSCLYTSVFTRGTLYANWRNSSWTRKALRQLSEASLHSLYFGLVCFSLSLCLLSMLPSSFLSLVNFLILIQMWNCRNNFREYDQTMILGLNRNLFLEFLEMICFHCNKANNLKSAKERERVLIWVPTRTNAHLPMGMAKNQITRKIPNIQKEI